MEIISVLLLINCNDVDTNKRVNQLLKHLTENGTMFIEHEEVQLISGLSSFGSAVHATVSDICWIESEKAFHGKTKTGDKYLFWNVSKEGKSREYRRIRD